MKRDRSTFGARSVRSMAAGGAWLAVLLPFGCGVLAPTDDTGGSAASGGSDAGAFGCGIVCDPSNPCDPGYECLASAKGGTVCKPASCPTCSDGKFCTYDLGTCAPLGCTSASCGYPYVDGCDDCVVASCCSQSLTCADDPACAVLMGCAADCKPRTSACVTACARGASAVAQEELQAAFDCIDTSCGPACGGS